MFEFKEVKRVLKDSGKAGFGVLEMFAGLAISSTIPVLGVPIVYDGAIRTVNGVTGVDSNKSMMVTTKNKLYNKMCNCKPNTITQNIPTLPQLFKTLTIKDKKSFLIVNELNFLLGADKLDKDGNPILYSTKSQSITKFMLRSANKAGFIENFTAVEIQSKALMFEKLMLGNANRNIKKKDKMFDMSFNITDKNITDDDIKKFLGTDNLDDKRFNIKRDKEGNIKCINQKVISALTDRFNDIKSKMLDTSLNKKMLPEPKVNSLDKEDKNKLFNELSQLVVDPSKLQFGDKKETIKQVSLDERGIE